MRIKKIEWREHSENNAPNWFSSTLPFQHNARVMGVHDNRFQWGICKGSVELVCGEASTSSLAKGACQTAWEKMVMEAFEEEACLFCGRVDRTRPLSIGDDLNVSIIPQKGGSLGTMVIEKNGFKAVLPSKYCFHCGRKLGGEQ